MSFAAECFVENVERFCEWAETDKHDLVEARQHLITLMTSIPWLAELRYASKGVDDFPRRGHDEWSRDHKRFADLPFQYYRSVFDPHDLDSTDEPVMDDLHDDLADIYGELWHGLQAHRSGQTREALSLWVDSYFYHWGYHASSALKAIDEFYRENYDRSMLRRPM
jgi:hypothetical protein